jgi:hypothetical protein
MVCADCLRSVDPGSGDTAEAASICPYCGGRMEGIGDSDDGPDGADFNPLIFDAEAGDLPPWGGTDASGSTVDVMTMGQLGRFQLRELLGGGAFGRVYRAYDPRLDRDVALKVLNEARPNGRHLERFFREARAAAQLDHPHIVPLHDAGRDRDCCWIAYQYVAGHSLARMCEAGILPVEKSARVVRSLADALDHAHRRGVCHRDVKPANVIIDPEGRPRLTDFGLAKRLDVHSNLTKEGAIVGTPAYMSPEQAAGHANLVDPRSDIYSLGVTLYELLCGRRPLDMPSEVPAWRVMGAVRLAMPYVPPSKINKNVDRRLDRICRRAMALDPQDRYADAAALAEDLDRWVRRPTWGGLLVASGVAFVVVLAFAGDVLVRLRTAPGRAAGPVPAAGQEAEPVLSFGPLPPGARLGPSEAPAVIANRGSHIYHRPECQSIASMSQERRVEFDSEADAARAGYKPCFYCHKESAR